LAAQSTRTAIAKVASSRRRGGVPAIDAAEEAGDMATSDLYTEITREVDLSIYFLQSHLD
jgi:DNA-binding ferritin-like protein